MENLVDLNKQCVIKGDVNIDWMGNANLYTREMKQISESENLSRQIRLQPELSNKNKIKVLNKYPEEH